ncbi:hypothetical protein IW261DRAFT_1426215 [Armillaria novae-zelandiae]|uniref:Nucleoplasmin-like domain-containing protein n=1 Tax=Armillaria novae-zelandiae TaxID=153914 RepID=A0AA39U7K1_9AGAR|nr:hypothetical protein IW261DRAFT_1426215 [Armillaria novae-zelandiae]
MTSTPTPPGSTVVRSFGAWALQVLLDQPQTFKVRKHEIIITNVALAAKPKSKNRTTLRISFPPVAFSNQEDEPSIETAPYADLVSLTPLAAEQSVMNLTLNKREQYCFNVEGDNAICLFGHFISHIRLHNDKDDKAAKAAKAPRRDPVLGEADSGKMAYNPAESLTAAGKQAVAGKAKQATDHQSKCQCDSDDDEDIPAMLYKSKNKKQKQTAAPVTSSSRLHGQPWPFTSPFLKPGTTNAVKAEVAEYVRIYLVLVYSSRPSQTR